MLHNVNLNNPKIQKILSEISKNVFTREKMEIIAEKSKTNDKCDIYKDYHPASDSYFYKAYQHHDHRAFDRPRAAYLTVDGENYALHKEVNKGMLKLQRALCAKVSPLAAFYHKEGFIGWHHNGDVPGLNILFSYSQDGKGSFRYYDYKSKSIVKMIDKPGWNVKVGYYPDVKQEPENVFWHTADTINERLSIAFIIPDRHLWLAMLEDITGGDYNKEILLEGPKKDS